MKTPIIALLLLCCIQFTYAQSCDELMRAIQSKYYGTSYTSYTSTAISKVTFYEVSIDYQTRYFAVVCFKREYAYNCSEYLYQVGSNTKFNYSLNYLSSAGQAFWKYIAPYNDVLGCAPDFE